MQIMDEVCAHCPHQQPSGYCPLRRPGACVLSEHVWPIVEAIGGALRNMEDPEYLANHPTIERSKASTVDMSLLKDGGQ